MKLESKFNQGDIIWFSSAESTMGLDSKIKFFEGEITAVRSWENSIGFRYNVLHIDSNGMAMNYDINEVNIYKSKKEILDTAFEEQGKAVNVNELESPVEGNEE